MWQATRQMTKKLDERVGENSSLRCADLLIFVSNTIVCPNQYKNDKHVILNSFKNDSKVTQFMYENKRPEQDRFAKE